jgi:hypothetical protein
MSLGHGTNIVKEGLAFYYDIANTQKSWLGEPTTNLVLSPKSITTGYAAQAGVTRLDNQLLNFDDTFTAGSLSNSGWIAYTSASTTNGNRYTASWYVKAGTTTSCTFNWGGAHQGNRTDFTFNLLTGQITNLSQAAGEDYNATALKNGWWRVWYSSTLSSGNAFYPQLNNGSGTMYVGGLQIEQKPYATRGLVIGTRTNNQAILDLTRKNTITVDSLTYNSNDSFSFNGSSNFISVPLTNIGVQRNTFSIETWVKFSDATANVIFNAKGQGLYPRITFNSSNILVAQYRPNGVTTSIGSSAISLNIWYHVVFAYSSITGSTLYVNGTLQSVNNTNLGTHDGGTSGNMLIGSDTNLGNWGKGNIDVVKMYDKVLTTQEVQQNFEALRERYGI